MVINFHFTGGSDMKMTGTWKGVLVGGVVGAACALLLAPKSGRKLRENLKRSAHDMYDKTADVTQSVRDKTAELAKDIRDKTAELKKNVHDKTVEVAQETADKANEAVKAIGGKVESISEKTRDMAASAMNKSRDGEEEETPDNAKTTH
jgi:gas vesicle protein